MDSIRIDTGVKKIYVNGGPEYIEFNPSDVTFAEKFYQLVKDFNAKQIEYEERHNKINENVGVDANGVPVNLSDGLALIRDFCEFTRGKIDELFGEGTSQKVFGNALTLNMFQQFFQGITPFIKVAREAKIAPYTTKKGQRTAMK
jgi:hypothetical protein